MKNIRLFMNILTRIGPEIECHGKLINVLQPDLQLIQFLTGDIF